MVLSRLPQHLALVALWCLLICVQQCASLPECLSIDPTDRLSFDKWTDCGNGMQVFTVMEYSEVATEPYDPVSKFFLTNAGVAGQFCIQSEVAQVISQNLFSEVVYRQEMASANPNNLLSIVDEQNTLYREVNFYQIDSWGTLSGDWLSNWETPFKLQITAELAEGESMFIEKLVATDLESTQAECRATPEEEETTTIDSEITETSTWTSDDPIDYETSTTDEGTSVTTPPTEIPWTSTTIEEDTDPTDSTITDDPSPITSSPTPATSPGPEPNPESSTENSTKEPEELVKEKEKSEDMWMIIAIVFISLFCLSILLAIYHIFLPRVKAAHQASSRGANVESAKTAKLSASPAQSGFNASKLPRLYIDRMQDKPVITAQHKKV